MEHPPPPIGSSQSDSRDRQWAAWAAISLQRLPLPYGVTIALAMLIVALEQVMEQGLSDTAALFPIATLVGARLAIPLITGYELAMLYVMRHRALTALRNVRPVVLVNDDEYDQLVRRMVLTSRRAEVWLLLASTLVVFVVWGVLESPLAVLGASSLPAHPLQAGVIVAVYIFQGFVGLGFLYAIIRFGTGLGQLARKPLVVNVFDPVPVLPLGYLSLLNSLCAAGIIIVLLILLGPPTRLISYAVILGSSLVSLMALVVPLWGVHRQMSEAKERALQRLHEELLDCQSRLLTPLGNEPAAIKGLAERTEALMQLRTTILRGPTWPFRGMGDSVGAVTAAMSPLVYFVITEFIRLVIPRLWGP